MRARQKNYELMYRLNKAGINADLEQTNILRLAELTLGKWAEKECGGGNDYNSWHIERDETTGKPFMHVHPNKGNSYSFPIADKEKGAIERVKKVCKALNIHFFHQTDP